MQATREMLNAVIYDKMNTAKKVWNDIIHSMTFAEAINTDLTDSDDILKAIENLKNTEQTISGTISHIKKILTLVHTLQKELEVTDLIIDDNQNIVKCPFTLDK